MTLRPCSPPPGAGCDLPAGLLRLDVPEDVKPKRDYGYWPADAIWRWLENSTGEHIDAPDLISGPEVEERMHVALDDARGTSLERHLFTTEGLVFGETWSLLVRAQGEDAQSFEGLAPFGGEGRLAFVEQAEMQTWPQPPDALIQKVRGGSHIRMLLATPARFAGGWWPGWLDSTFIGAPPSAPGVRLRLVAAAVPRRAAVSGWDRERGQPKAVRWLVPAGAVYFFDVVKGDPASLTRSAWLEPVSDDEQDRRDGYGLALWGVWTPEGEEI